MTDSTRTMNPSDARRALMRVAADSLPALAATPLSLQDAIDRLTLALDGATAGADAAHDEFNEAEKEAIATGGIDHCTPRLQAAQTAQRTAVAIFDSIVAAIAALPGNMLPTLRLKAKAAVRAGGSPEGDSLSRSIIAELATQRAA